MYLLCTPLFCHVPVVEYLFPIFVIMNNPLATVFTLLTIFVEGESVAHFDFEYSSSSTSYRFFLLLLLLLKVLCILTFNMKARDDSVNLEPAWERLKCQKFNFVKHLCSFKVGLTPVLNLHSMSDFQTQSLMPRSPSQSSCTPDVHRVWMN